LSHLEERKEKICLNCQAELYGRYCHKCGQENLEPKESVWHLINHFFQDITHFDGKFFTTVKDLITKPGFLSLEYMKGKRASYLNPIRMYVFTSAIFFLILFSLRGTEDFMKLDENNKPTNERKEGISDWEHQAKRAASRLKEARTDKESDTTELADNLVELNEKIAVAKKIYGDTSTLKFDVKDVALMMLRANTDSLRKGGMPDSIIKKMNDALVKRDSLKLAGKDEADLFNISAKKYPTAAAYDSLQKLLPSSNRDGWLTRLFVRKVIEIRNEINSDKNGFFEKFKEKILHSFPKILFISLPFFALILKLVYIRRKQYYYTSHGIFTIHLYCATFILMLVYILFNQLQGTTSWKWLNVVFIIIDLVTWLYMMIYFYKAMRKFYGQGWFKTLVKYFIISFLALIVNVFLFLVFILISAISI